jgi:predicted AAA+ superfamily ATPase
MDLPVQFYAQTQAACHALNASQHRSLLRQIDWKHRLIGIRGPRGVGKTTLMLQHLQANYGTSPSALYLTLDDFYFTENRLIDLARAFEARGGKILYLDEVHKYPHLNWAQEIKNIYDLLPGLKIVFTGSSILKIRNEQADLSRRALVYDLQGLSFREYLNMTLPVSLPAFSLPDVLHKHEELSREVVFGQTIRPLSFFHTYLREGYFPFFLENRDIYLHRVREVIKLIIEVDFNYIPEYNITDHVKISRLLYAFASSVPFKPNITKLGERVELNRTRLTQYIYLLERARLLNLLHSRNKGLSSLQKPEKIYLENTNLIHALAPGQTDMGSLRETFFVNQLNAPNPALPFQPLLFYPEQGDFLLDTYAEQYLFEVGGKNKDFRQLPTHENSFLALDEMEIGYGRKIPLWLFGFLY